MCSSIKASESMKPINSHAIHLQVMRREVKTLHPGTKGDFIFHQALFQLNSTIEVSYLVLRTSYSWLVKYLPCKHEDLNWSQELMVKVDCGGSCLQSQSWGGPLEFAGSQSNWISKLQVQQEPLFKEKVESDWGSHSLSTSGLHTHKLHTWSGSSLCW